MITVNRHNDGITITGHAGFEDYGQDIVCAGVSAIVQTLIQSVEDLTTDEIDYTIQPGFVDIRFITISGESQVLFDAAMIGLQMIENAYPHNVTIE